MVKKKRDRAPAAGDTSDEAASSSSAPLCHHVKKAVDLGKLRRALKGRPPRGECPECATNSDPPPKEKKEDGAEGSGPDAALRTCLACGAQLCERHALRHFETPRSEQHALVARAGTLEVHCRACGRDVDPQRVGHGKLAECVEQLRRWTADGAGGSSERSPTPEERQRPIALPMAAPPHSLELSPSPSRSHLDSSSCSPSNRRVRGLSNLGNTCFFNSVLQCLAQTPHLDAVLRETSEGGEDFTFAGGKVKIPKPERPKKPPKDDNKDKEENGEDDKEQEEEKPAEEQEQEEEEEEPQEREIEVPPVTGRLDKWGPITETLADTLHEMRSSGRSDVFTPRKLLNAFVAKAPHFGGGDQHDSHELLRHLLEAVRNEDLKRYRTVILQKLGFDSKEKRKDVPEETKQTIKFYGQQASDDILRPGQVFRGTLVSTLECQDCKHSSHTTEHFLDLSLPITADKPQPPAVQRRMMQEEQNNSGNSNKMKNGRPRRSYGSKYDNKSYLTNFRNFPANQSGDNKSENKSSSEQSDADVEDNADDNLKLQNNEKSGYFMESGYNSEKVISSDSIRANSVAEDYSKEKADVSPERTDKDAEDGKFPSGIPYKNFNKSNPDSGVASPETSKNTESAEGVKELGSPASLSSEINMDVSSPRQGNNSPVDAERPLDNMIETLAIGWERNLLDLTTEKSDRPVAYNKADYGINQSEGPNPRLTSPDDDDDSPKWKKDTSPFGNNNNNNRNGSSSHVQRSLSEEGEYSIQSCLKQFTAAELLTGNNKVGCEACTKRAEADKTVYTNATKKFEIASTPAVMILHLKRFQLGGPRNVLRKITKHVNFPLVVDVAPFCNGKHPGRALYSLYGVVEHSGSTLQFGHYVAYVKVRPDVKPGDPRHGFVPDRKSNGVNSNQKEEPVNGGGRTACNDNDTDSSLSGYESGEAAMGVSDEAKPPSGKWYYISDSRVTDIAEEKVLKVQAYLLFYERIL